MVTKPPRPQRPNSAQVDGVRSHRQRVLLSIFAESERPLSATDLARLTGQSLGATAHHVRALARAELIEWAGERRVRGAMQTFYRATTTGVQALRGPRTEALLTLVGVRGSFTGDAPAVPALDEAACTELEALVQRVRPQVMDIMRRAAGRTTT